MLKFIAITQQYFTLIEKKSQEYIGMAQNSEIETPNGQSLFAQEQDISPAERAILERVLALSLEDESYKASRKNDGLSLKYRKLISSMKMTKSSQKCTICYSNFAQNQIIKKMPCKHIYHRDCVKSWLKINHKCPNCRLDLQNHFQILEKEGKLPLIQVPKCKASKIKQEVVHIVQNQAKST